jgi:hypothetical protein
MVIVFGQEPSVVGVKVPEIRWDNTGSFKVIVFKPGDWERTLRIIADASDAAPGHGGR